MAGHHIVYLYRDVRMGGARTQRKSRGSRRLGIYLCLTRAHVLRIIYTFIYIFIIFMYIFIVRIEKWPNENNIMRNKRAMYLLPQ